LHQGLPQGPEPRKGHRRAQEADGRTQVLRRVRALRLDRGATLDRMGSCRFRLFGLDGVIFGARRRGRVPRALIAPCND
jgi:hypothetical protein